MLSQNMLSRYAGTLLLNYSKEKNRNGSIILVKKKYNSSKAISIVPEIYNVSRFQSKIMIVLERLYSVMV